MSDKNPANRPLIPVDWDQVEKMCAIQCTGEEIAGVMGFSYDTLERACKREQNLAFAEYMAQKRQEGKASLRRKQYTTAMEGNPTMLVWLGKNWLNQTDKQDIVHDHSITAFEVVADED